MVLSFSVTRSSQSPHSQFLFQLLLVRDMEDFGDLRFHLTPLNIAKLGDASMTCDRFCVEVEASIIPPILDEEDLEEYESKLFHHYHEIEKYKWKYQQKNFVSIL